MGSEVLKQVKMVWSYITLKEMMVLAKNVYGLQDTCSI